mgnify:CR=1 FL=1
MSGKTHFRVRKTTNIWRTTSTFLMPSGSLSAPLCSKVCPTYSKISTTVFESGMFTTFPQWTGTFEPKSKNPKNVQSNSYLLSLSECAWYYKIKLFDILFNMPYFCGNRHHKNASNGDRSLLSDTTKWIAFVLQCRWRLNIWASFTLWEV